MNWIKRKAVGLFAPEGLKDWFPFVSKVVSLAAVGVFGYLNPDLATKLMDVLEATIGKDEAFVALVGTTAPGVVKIVLELVADFKQAVGDPTSRGPIIQTPTGHAVYDEEYKYRLGQVSYEAAVKVATKRARSFEKALLAEQRRLMNEGGMSSDEAFIRARNVVRSKGL